MEGTLRRVLAAVDLSPMGRRVADRARIIAEVHHARLTLVHVVTAELEEFLGERHRSQLTETSSDLACQLAEWVRSRTHVPVDLVVPEGHAVHEVAKIAKQSDLVLAGTSSQDAARVGPTTRRLARMARVGVVAVRRQPRVPYRRVIAAVDLSDGSREAVELATTMAPEAEVNAVYAVDSRFDELLATSGLSEEDIVGLQRARVAQAKDALEDFVSEWPGVKPQVVTGLPSMALNEVVRRRSADLVTVASKGGGGNSMVLLGTVAEEVMESAPCDVAVARVASKFRRP